MWFKYSQTKHILHFHYAEMAHIPDAHEVPIPFFPITIKHSPGKFIEEGCPFCGSFYIPRPQVIPQDAPHWRFDHSDEIPPEIVVAIAAVISAEVCFLHKFLHTAFTQGFGGLVYNESTPLTDCYPGSENINSEIIGIAFKLMCLLAYHLNNHTLQEDAAHLNPARFVIPPKTLCAWDLNRVQCEAVRYLQSVLEDVFIAETVDDCMAMVREGEKKHPSPPAYLNDDQLRAVLTDHLCTSAKMILDMAWSNTAIALNYKNFMKFLTEIDGLIATSPKMSNKEIFSYLNDKYYPITATEVAVEELQTPPPSEAPSDDDDENYDDDEPVVELSADELQQVHVKVNDLLKKHTKDAEKLVCSLFPDGMQYQDDTDSE